VNTRKSVGLAEIENLPSALVWVIFVVPLTATVTPGTGAEFSITVPVMVFCANALMLNNVSNRTLKHIK
jgi:hypothetical protein